MDSHTQHRLRKHPDYQRVYSGARKQWAKQIGYFSLGREAGSEAERRSETKGPRVGLTVPKALGKAVDRNRIKRRLRVLARECLPLLHDLPVDVVLHPKRTVLDADFAALQREVAIIFKSVHARHGASSPARQQSTVQGPPVKHTEQASQNRQASRTRRRGAGKTGLPKQADAGQ